MRESEYKRQRRLVGFYLSAHSSIAERLHRRHQVLLAVIIVLSVLATSFAFAGEDRHVDVLIEASLPTWAGILSALVFLLALLDLLLGWERIAAEHEEAVRRLDPLAALYRGFETDGSGVVETGRLDLDREYWNVVTTIARIPNRDFGRLKAQHLHKIEVSKALDDAKSTPAWIVSSRLRVYDTRRFLREYRNPPAPPPPDAPVEDIPATVEEPPPATSPK